MGLKYDFHEYYFFCASVLKSDQDGIEMLLALLRSHLQELLKSDQDGIEIVKACEYVCD